MPRTKYAESTARRAWTEVVPMHRASLTATGVLGVPAVASYVGATDGLITARMPAQAGSAPAAD